MVRAPELTGRSALTTLTTLTTPTALTTVTAAAAAHVARPPGAHRDSPACALLGRYPGILARYRRLSLRWRARILVGGAGAALPQAALPQAALPTTYVPARCC